ncbi:unnamed protein product [Ixodes pacificus]
MLLLHCRHLLAGKGGRGVAQTETALSLSLLCPSKSIKHAQAHPRTLDEFTRDHITRSTRGTKTHGTPPHGETMELNTITIEQHAEPRERPSPAEAAKGGFEAHRRCRRVTVASVVRADGGGGTTTTYAT